jgi:hypothetical protein
LPRSRMVQISCDPSLVRHGSNPVGKLERNQFELE